MTLRRLGRIQSFCPTRPNSCLAKKAGSRSRIRWTRIYHSSLACLVWQASLASNHQATFRTTSHSKPAKSLLPHITHTTRSVSVRWHPWSTRTRISPWLWIPKMSRSSSIQIKVQRLKIWFASLKIARVLLPVQVCHKTLIFRLKVLKLQVSKAKVTKWISLIVIYSNHRTKLLR